MLLARKRKLGQQGYSNTSTVSGFGWQINTGKCSFTISWLKKHLIELKICSYADRKKHFLCHCRTLQVCYKFMNVHKYKDKFCVSNGIYRAIRWKCWSLLWVNEAFLKDVPLYVRQRLRTKLLTRLMNDDPHNYDSFDIHSINKAFERIFVKKIIIIFLEEF